MDTESAFIAAMAAEPDDDTPRLVFADWLDEHGRPEWAEFIRLQCGPSANEDRAAELLKMFQPAWDRSFEPFGGEVLYRRGFPHYLKAEFERVVEHQTLLGLAPDWHLTPTRDDHDYDDPQPGLWARFAAGPFVERVRALNLAWAGWTEEELGALFVRPLVGRLRAVRFGDDDHCLAALELLRRVPDLKLETLGFGGDSYGGIGDEGCAVLAGDARFASLTELELPNNDLSAVGMLALANSPHVTRLCDLDLAGGSNSTNTIGDDGVRHIAGSANFRHLTDLNLACNGVTDPGFLALLQSPHLHALTHLNLPMNELSDASLVALGNSAGLPALRWLNLSAGFRARMSGAAVAQLVRSPRTERLTGLKLGSHPIGDEGARALAESPNCRNLRELHIGSCGIHAEAFARMLESPHLAGVSKFSTHGNRITKAEITALRERHGSRID